MKIQVKRRIEAPAADLWAYLGDYSNIYRFHPMLSGSHFNEGSQTCEIGSTRQCDFKNGEYLREKITDWKEGSHYTVDIYDTSMPIENAKATLGVRAISPTESEAFMDIEMDAKQKWMAPMLYLSFRYNAAPSILRGLEELYQQENALAAA